MFSNLKQADYPRLRDVWKARKRISSMIRKTPLIKSPLLSEKVKADVYLKLENLQETGAFKVRGAANKILSLSLEERQRGVTTFSTGNHGLAVAYVAQQLGIEAVVCVSSRVPQAKLESIQRMGGSLKIVGQSQDEAGAYCYELQKKQGFTVIEPFDDAHIIAGQATIGLEIVEELPEVDSVYVPLSGGGLMSGVGLALKSMDPDIEVIGTSMEHAAVMYESLKAGKLVELPEQDTLADSLLGGIGLNNQFTFRMVQQYMDKVMLIPEEAIAKSIAFMLQQHRLVIEGAAGTVIAALLRKEEVKAGSQVVLLISGSNVDPSVLLELT